MTWASIRPSAATASTISSRSTYVNGFDSGRCRSGSEGSSFTRQGSGFVIPTKSSPQRPAAPRRYSRWPLWNGWNLPWIIPRRLLDDDAASLLDVADPADEEPSRGELGLERRPLRGRERDEQAARRLRVVAERRQHAGDAVGPDVRRREVAVPRVAARADALARHVERAVDRREALRLEPKTHAAPLRDLPRVPEEPEAGHVGHRVRLERTEDVRGVAVQRPHPADRPLELLRARVPSFVARHDQARPERLREEERIARAGAVLRPDPVGANGADHRETVLRLGVTDGVPAREEPARRAHLLVGRGEDLGEHLHRQLLREGGDREREERRTAHCEDVVERVRCCDGAVVGGVVDDGREEVEREDQRALVVEPVDRRVVGGREPDQEVLRLDRHEAGEQLLESGRRVLRRAPPARREIGQLGWAGLSLPPLLIAPVHGTVATWTNPVS